MEKHTPCWQRDEWTRDPNRGHDKTEGEKVEDLTSTLRAQLICATRCDQQQDCLKQALSFPAEDDWFIWGGYTAAERRHIRENGPLPVPVSALRRTVKLDVVNTFIDSNADGDTLASHWGVTFQGLANTMRSYLWNIRADAECPGVLLQDGPEGSENGMPQSAANVAAA